MADCPNDSTPHTAAQATAPKVAQQAPLAMSISTPPDQAPALKAEASAGEDDPRAELRRYVEAFGSDNGAQWYLDGLSFAAAQAKHAEALQAENTKLRRRLHAAGYGEDEPVRTHTAGKEQNATPKD